MLEHHARGRTENWREPQTCLEFFPGTDSAAAPTMAWPDAATMAQPTAAVALPVTEPRYAWSAESPAAEYPLPIERPRGLLRPTAFAWAGVAAAAAVAVVVLLSGPTGAAVVSTPNVTTPVAPSQAAAEAPSVSMPETTIATPRQHVRASRPTNPGSQDHEPASQPSSTSSDQSTEQHPNHWEQRRETTPPRWDMRSFGPRFEAPERHDGDHDASHRDERSAGHESEDDGK